MENQFNLEVFSQDLYSKDNCTECVPKASLVTINDNCLLHICEYLELAELLSLQRVCKRLESFAISAYKKLADATIEPATFNGGNVTIDFIFNQIGEYVQSLSFNFWGEKCVRNILRKLLDKCNRVKCLTIKSWHENGKISTFGYFDNVEMLTLNECTISSCIEFFACFRNLKCLNIYNCKNFGMLELKYILLGNPNLESLLFFSDLRISNFVLAYVPKVKRLSLNALKSRVQLYELTKLSLHVSDIIFQKYDLTNLNRNIKELELILNVHVDENFFTGLRLLDNLQLLYIRTIPPITLMSLLVPLLLHSSLKHCRLAGFEISFQSLISLIKTCKQIENVDLRDCFIVRYQETYINNINVVSQEILKTMELSDCKQKINVILPVPRSGVCVDMDIANCSKMLLFDSSRLRILNNRFYLSNENPLRIGIDFHSLL